MNHDTDHDFHQFRGTFDSAITPDAEFKAKMEKLLKAEKPVVTERTSSVLASPPKRPSESIMPARRSSPLMIAAAVLTVFAVVVASVWVLSGDMLEGEYASAPSGIATMPADAPETPGPDVQLTANSFHSAPDGIYLQGIYDGVVITQQWREHVSEKESEGGSAVHSPERTSVIVAQDQATGEVLWELDQLDFSSPRVSNSVLVATRLNWNDLDSQGNPKLEVLALNLKTGEVLWSIPVGDVGPGPVVQTVRFDLEVAANRVFIVYHSGTVQALDITSGEEVWETEFDPGDGEILQFRDSNDQEWQETRYNVATAIWNDLLAIVSGNYILATLDIETGELRASHNLSESEPHDGRLMMLEMEIQPIPTGILLTSLVSGSDTPNSVVQLVDPVTGEVQWTHEFEGTIDLHVAENGAITVNSHIWKLNSWLLQLFGQSGYSTHQLFWMDGKTGVEILQTERSRSDWMPFAMTDGTYACTRSDISEIVCFDRSGTRYLMQELIPTGIPVMVKGVLYVPTADGLYKVQLP